MDPIPIEEAVLRPVVSWAISMFMPIGLHRVLLRVLSRTNDGAAWRPSVWLVDIAAVMIAWMLGQTALGPRWLDTSHDFGHFVFASICALTTFFVARASRRRMDRRSSPEPITGAEKRAGFITASILVSGIVCLAFAIVRFTRIDSGEIPSAGESAAMWRIRIDPWDSHAWLASAWATRERNDLAMAQAQLELAIELGAPTPEALELQSELHAANGNCALARERFEEALSARAARAFETPFELELGGWHLPRTLVSECGYGAADP